MCNEGRGTVRADPQNSGFLYGRFRFNEGEKDRLGKAFDRINSERCRKFDDKLAELRKAGQIQDRGPFTPSTLQGVLNITTLNKYSPDLTARQVGISERRWAEVQSNFAQEGTSRYSGVTLADGRVFLRQRILLAWSN